MGTPFHRDHARVVRFITYWPNADVLVVAGVDVRMNVGGVSQGVEPGTERSLCRDGMRTEESRCEEQEPGMQKTSEIRSHVRFPSSSRGVRCSLCL